MPLTPFQTLALQDTLSVHLDRILESFKPGAKITVVVRNPGYGDAGVVIGNDDLNEAVAEIQRRVAADKYPHGRCLSCGWPNAANGCCTRTGCCDSE